MQSADQMQHLSTTETHAENRIIAKIIIMIYEINNKGHLEVATRLKNQFRLHGWDYIELAHKDAIKAPAQHDRPECIRRMEEFVVTERRFFERLQQFISPTYINLKGEKIIGGWEAIKKLISIEDAAGIQDLIYFMQQLYQLHSSFQFMQHPIIASVMNRLETNNPQLYFKFWVEFLYISSTDPNSPYPLFHSVIPCKFLICNLHYLEKIAQTQRRISDKLTRIPPNSRTRYLNAHDMELPVAYFESILIMPVQSAARYRLLFSDVLNSMNDNDPLFNKMQLISNRTNELGRHLNQLLHQFGPINFVKFCPKWISTGLINYEQAFELAANCCANPIMKNVTFYMKKYQFTFHEAKAWASNDLQNWFLRYAHLRKILPDDIYFNIATFFVPITQNQALSIFNKVVPVFNINLSSQIIKNYLTGTVTTLTKPQVVEHWMKRALSLSMSLFSKNDQVSVRVVPHYMNAARVYKAFNSIQDFSQLQDILQTSAAELKEIINRPADNRYEHFINFILQKLEESKLIERSEAKVPQLKGG